MWKIAHMSKAREIADALTQARIAAIVGVGVTAVNNAVARGKFPARYFLPLSKHCAAVGIDCPEDAFAFATNETDAA